MAPPPSERTSSEAWARLCVCVCVCVCVWLCVCVRGCAAGVVRICGDCGWFLFVVFVCFVSMCLFEVLSLIAHIWIRPTQGHSHQHQTHGQLSTSEGRCVHGVRSNVDGVGSQITGPGLIARHNDSVYASSSNLS